MNVNTNIFPTPYKDINAFLQILLDNVRAVLGDRFTGMYLYGSLALGDFDPGRSDIDFLIVTRESLPDNFVSKIKNMHENLIKNGNEWAAKLEGAYIPLDALRKYSPTGPACPLVNKYEFLVACPESHWVLNRHILYTSGIVITGPPPQSIIDPIQPEQLKEAVVILLRNNWTRFIYDANLFNGIGYQPFITLTMCRALYTLKHGVVVSKTRSAVWAKSSLNSKWTKLIEQAIDWHYGDEPGDTGKTQEFMRYIFKEAGL